MTPHEWRQIQTEIEQLWGRSPKWGAAASLTHRVAGIPFDTAMAVINDLMGDRYVPAPADIIGKARQRTGGTHDTARPGVEDCNHVMWAVLPDLPDGNRLGVCNACLLERRFPKARLETIGEWETRTGKTQTQEWGEW